MDVCFLANGPYSFSLAPGECVGLSGRSGIGKTQLLRAIADLIPHSGVVRLDGVAADEIPAPLWRRKVGMVPADPAWWYDQVGDHFPKTEGDGEVLPFLGQLGFGQDVLHWDVSRLSTGERQRLAFVRALVPKPRVLLLDEPSAALDDCATGLLEDLVAELRKERQLAVVWVSHDPLQLRRVASRIFTVEERQLTRQSSG